MERETGTEIREEKRWELKSARYLAADILRCAVRDGDTVVDATMGNGHDTELLCTLAGEAGRVYAFDIQPAAVESTRKRLTEAGLIERAELHCTGHEKMSGIIPGPVQAVVFNLGWLPGGDHGITTRTETTRKAVEQAMNLLLPGGILVVCVYPGHPEGMRELTELTGWFSALPPRDWNVLRQTFLNAGPGAPVCFVLQKQPVPQASVQPAFRCSPESITAT